MLDTLDGQVEAEVQTEMVASYRSAPSPQPQPSLNATAGIPARVSADIERLIAKRQS